MSFPFLVLLPAVWNVCVMAGAAVAKLAPELTPRKEVLCSRVTRWKEVGPWSYGGPSQPLTFTEGEEIFFLTEAAGLLLLFVNCNETYP